jgi:hypothetical protein
MKALTAAEFQELSAAHYAQFKRATPIARANLGDGANNVNVSGRPGYVYARLKDTAQLVQVLNKRVQTANDLEVTLGYYDDEPGYLQVLGFSSVATPGYDGTNYGVPTHGSTHHWGDTDPVYIDQDQITYAYLRANSPASMDLNIDELWYTDGDGAPDRITATTTGSAAYASAVAGLAAGQAVWVCTTATKTAVTFTVGAAFSSYWTGDKTSYMPDPPGGQVILGDVYLKYGDTAITQDRIDGRRRSWLSPFVPTSGSAISGSGEAGMVAVWASTNALTSGSQAAMRNYGGLSYLLLERANGSEGSETYLTSGQNIGGFGFSPWTGTDFAYRASVAAQASEAHSGSAQGTRLVLNITPQGSTSPTEGARLLSSKHLLVNTTTDGGTLTAKSDGTLPGLVIQTSAGANVFQADKDGILTAPNNPIIGGYVFNIPASGSASLIDVAQTVSATKTHTATIQGSGTLARIDANSANLVPNGAFDAWSAGSGAAPDGWFSTGTSLSPTGAYAVQSGSCVSPSYGVKLGDGTNAWRGMCQTDPIPVTPTAAYMLSMQLAGGDSAARAIVAAKVYDASGSAISGSAASYLGSSWSYSATLDGWYFYSTPGATFTRVTRNVTPTSAVYFVRFTIQYYSSGSSSLYIYADDVQLTRGSLAPPFQRHPILESNSGSAQSVYDPLNLARVGFNGTTNIAKPTVTGSRGGNAALASLLTALADYGLIVDSSSA